ncbi:hypothetical protein ACFRAE_04905 [Sphingobacterium sp. HJSM2_6]|uniref:hypothetical protein n=1 Tax=Sphingobacterium sp. HJSM2_6 TaxID=3366264 RepID=UPI003BD20EE1
MKNESLNTLIEFLEKELAADVLSIPHPNFYYLQCRNLVFDLVYITHAPPEASYQIEKKLISIDEIIFQSATQKIYDRLKVQAGLARRIYARQTVVARIDKRTSLNFLDEYHVQPSIPGKYRYGLYFEGELYAIAVFSGARIMREISDSHRSFELLRFCQKSNYIVVGGLSKLLKEFAKDFHPQDIMTYADLSWTQESSLQKLGFQIKGMLSAQRFWWDGTKQVPIKSEAEELELRTQQPNGYVIHSNGSIKMVLDL